MNMSQVEGVRVLGDHRSFDCGPCGSCKRSRIVHCSLLFSMSRVDYVGFVGVGWGMSRFDGMWYSLGGIAVAVRDGFGLKKNGISSFWGR